MPINLNNLFRAKKQRKSSKLSWIRLSGRAKALSFVALFAVVGSAYLLHASATTPLYYFCDNSGSGPCLAVNGGRETSDNNIVMRSRSTTGKADDFHADYVGRVGGTWPFISGGGLNTKFSGDDVWQLEYAPGGVGSGWCAAVPDYSGGYVLLERCSNTTYWVEAYNGTYWVSVRATNSVNDHQIFVLWSNGQSSGSLTGIKDYQSGNGWEEFGTVKVN